MRTSKDAYMCNDVSLLIDQVLEGVESNKKNYKNVREEYLNKLVNHQKKVLDKLNEYYINITNNRSLIQNSDFKDNQINDKTMESKHIYERKVTPINKYLETIHSKIIDEILKVNQDNINIMVSENESTDENQVRILEQKEKELEKKIIPVENNINSLEKELTDNKNINNGKSDKKQKLMYINIGIGVLVLIGLLFINIMPFFRSKDTSKFTFLNLSDFKKTKSTNSTHSNTTKLNTPLNTKNNKTNNKSLLNTSKLNTSMNTKNNKTNNKSLLNTPMNTKNNKTNNKSLLNTSKLNTPMNTKNNKTNNKSLLNTSKLNTPMNTKNNKTNNKSLLNTSK